MIYLIYNHSYQKTINIVSINSLNDNENYNTYLSDYLLKANLNYKLNVDYSNNSLEIENLIALINKNDNNIQNKIHLSDTLIISIGNIDYKTEDLKTIINELKELFKLIRSINSKEIIFVSPYSIKNTYNLKELCNRYNIIFINGSSFKDKPSLLAQMLIKRLENTWNSKKY